MSSSDPVDVVVIGAGYAGAIATNRLLASLSAALRGYHLDPSDEIHALRTLRSMLHGFATLEVTGGFQFDTDIDDSFRWMINLIDHGLQSAQGAG